MNRPPKAGGFLIYMPRPIQCFPFVGRFHEP